MLKVDTTYSITGHLDEILNVVPPQNSQAPCDFRIITASNEAALKTLEAHPDEQFISETALGQYDRLMKKADPNKGVQDPRRICDALNDLLLLKEMDTALQSFLGGKPATAPNKTRSSIEPRHFRIDQLFFSPAWAGAGNTTIVVPFLAEDRRQLRGTAEDFLRPYAGSGRPKISASRIAQRAREGLSQIPTGDVEIIRNRNIKRAAIFVSNMFLGVIEMPIGLVGN